MHGDIRTSVSLSPVALRHLAPHLARIWRPHSSRQGVCGQHCFLRHHRSPPTSACHWRHPTRSLLTPQPARSLQAIPVLCSAPHLLPPFQSCCQYIRVPARDGTAAFPVPWQGQPQSLHLSSVLSACNFFPIGLAPQTACFPIHSGRRGYKVRRKQQFAVLLLFWCPIF